MFQLTRTVFPHPAFPTSMTGCRLFTNKSKKYLIRIVSVNINNSEFFLIESDHSGELNTDHLNTRNIVNLKLSAWLG